MSPAAASTSEAAFAGLQVIAQIEKTPEAGGAGVPGPRHRSRIHQFNT